MVFKDGLVCCVLQVMALGHPVIVVQCPGVSMRLGPVLPADAVVEQVVGVLDKLNVDQACVIGHSYGKGGKKPASTNSHAPQ